MPAIRLRQGPQKGKTLQVVPYTTQVQPRGKEPGGPAEHHLGKLRSK